MLGVWVLLSGLGKCVLLSRWSVWEVMRYPLFFHGCLFGGEMWECDCYKRHSKCYVFISRQALSRSLHHFSFSPYFICHESYYDCQVIFFVNFFVFRPA